MTFKGKTLLIVGGTCDIALECLKSLSESALNVFLTYRAEDKRLALEAALKSSSLGISFFKLALGDRSALASLFASIGHCDDLLDFAHEDYESLLASASSDHVARYFDSHVAFRADLLRMATRSMLSNRFGRLVFLSSVAADRVNPGQAFYSASKLAAEALYRSAGVELASKGITSAIVRAGLSNTGRGQTHLSHCKTALASIPTRRPLEASELASFLVFLLSDASLGLNASILTIDQGQSAFKPPLSLG
jgi:3-oxoacyl-[acyl-carrier protein] reductase